MIYLELLDIIDDLKKDQRELVINSIVKNLTSISFRTIQESQFEWDGKSPYKDFEKMQNQIIKECIEIEMTPFGKVLRRQEGLRPLTLRTDIFLY